MKKKRREIPEPIHLGLHSAGGSWVKSLSGDPKACGSEGGCTRYGICPFFGKGELLYFQWEEMELIFSRLNLRQQIILQHDLEEDCLQLSFLLEGEKVITAEESRPLVQVKGEAYLASLSGFRGEVRLGCETPFREVRIRIRPSALSDQVLRNFQNTRQLARQEQIRPVTKELFAILLDLEHQDFEGPVQSIFLRAKALELLALQLESYTREIRSPQPAYGTAYLRKLYQVRSRISDNLHRNFALADLAREVGMNANLLNEEFCKVFEESVHEFSIRQKMEMARLQLRQTDRLVYQIAEAVGYKNGTHFSAAFKRYFGMTPKQCRKAL